MLGMLAALVLFTTSAIVAEGPFRDISFTDAQAAAAKEKKVVLIDFFTTWCAPCKKLDATTWKDAEVVKWLDANCIPLKIDAELQKELAARFHVQAYPTIVLVKADGTQMDAIVGYRDAKAFLDEAAQALAGRDSLTRARDRLVGREDDPTERSRYADELVRFGRHEEALAQYLWCFDEGRDSPGYAGVRCSYLLSSVQRLGRVYPEAIRALETRRDAAEALLEAGGADFESGQDMDSINEVLSTRARTLTLFERLREKGPVPTEIRIALDRTVLDLLLEARRYEEVIELFPDVENRVDRKIEMTELSRSTLDGSEDESMAQVLEFLRANTVTECARFYEALLANKLTERAGKVADRLIGYAPSGATYAALITAAIRAESADSAKALAERGLAALADPKDKKQIETAAKRAAKPRPKPKPSTK